MALCVRVDVTGKQCVVFGGGNEGFRRAMQLKEENAKVTVYAPAFCAKFKTCPDLCKAKLYHPDLLKGAFFAAACTDSHAVNAQIVQDCLKRGILVVSSTKENQCPFHPMANRSWTEGMVAVSVPNAPAFAPKLAQILAQQAQQFAPKAKALAQLRKTAKQKLPKEEFAAAMKQAADCSAEQIQQQINCLMQKK